MGHNPKISRRGELIRSVLPLSAPPKIIIIIDYLLLSAMQCKPVSPETGLMLTHDARSESIISLKKKRGGTATGRVLDLYTIRTS
jgi:hypothetical protein